MLISNKEKLFVSKLKIVEERKWIFIIGIVIFKDEEKGGKEKI